jgi:hypothetical protein
VFTSDARFAMVGAASGGRYLEGRLAVRETIICTSDIYVGGSAMLKWITPLLVGVVLTACGGAPSTPEVPSEPGVEEPGVEEPGMEEPGMEEPGMEEPGMEEPGTEEPAPE